MSLARFRPHHKGRLDPWLLLAVLTLIGFGLVMISSASVVISSQQFDNNYAYVTRQLQHFSIGLIALIAGALIDYRIWKQYAFGILILIVVLLVATHVPGIGVTLQGAQRWISIGPVQFQPSELVKLLSILYFAAWFDARGDRLINFRQGFIPFVTSIGFVVLLILWQPDAGTAMVTLLTIVTMYFVAGAPWVHMVYGFVLGSSLLSLLILSAPYRLQRFLVFLNPSQETLGAAYHINQAMLAVGAGGLLGLGFGQSKQKFLYLPEPQTDSIFAIAIEELGFLRAVLILGLLIFIILRGFQIARTAADAFGKYIAVGITAWIAIQTFVNIGAMLGLIPLTGVTLPFISYGGSSLVVLMLSVGILLSISRSSSLHQQGRRA